MAARIKMEGLRFGRLTVEAEQGRDKSGAVMWRCKCDCGKYATVRGADLRRGQQKSCGCLRVETTSERDFVHGDSRSRLHTVWKGMRARCNNPHHTGYKNYGGRGIRLCPEWDDFEVFRNWALANGYDENAPRGQCTIDRINPDGNYCPENCRWADSVEQRHNQRRCKN